MVPKESRKRILDLLLTNTVATVANVQVCVSENIPAGLPEDWILSDFEEADFSGYARAAANFSPATLDTSYRAVSESGPLRWTMLSAGPSVTLRAVYLTLDSYSIPGLHLIYAQALDAPVTLSGVGEYFERRLKIFANNFIIV